MNTILPALIIAAFSLISSGAPARAGESAAQPGVWRSFAFRAVSTDAKADGETDFKGSTAVMSTEQRVAFLNAYTDYAAAWFGDPKLDQLAVTPGEAEQRVGQIKPQPLTVVRQTIRLNDGWKQMSTSTDAEKQRDRPWRKLQGAELKDCELVLPPGTNEVLDLAQSSGWRYELRWDARREQQGQPVRWAFGSVIAPQSSWLAGEGWHSFRLQADLAGKRGYLSVDGNRVADFALEHAPGKPVPFSILCDAPTGLRNLVFIDYHDRQHGRATQEESEQPGGVGQKAYNDRQPYEPVVLADDDFRTKPSVEGWNTPSYDDSRWLPASLPCVHGAFAKQGKTCTCAAPLICRRPEKCFWKSKRWILPARFMSMESWPPRARTGCR